MVHLYKSWTPLNYFVARKCERHQFSGDDGFAGSHLKKDLLVGLEFFHEDPVEATLVAH